MKIATLKVVVVAALLSPFMLLTPAEALPSGGGGGGGGGTCFHCDCQITGSIGGHTCGCPNSTSGGSGCYMHFDPLFGTDCYVLLGPCTQPLGGFAP
jgi:hypothetical protein